MTLVLQRETTEYTFAGVTGETVDSDVELAFLAAGTRPTAGDWEAAAKVETDAHALWDDAQAALGSASPTPAWFAAIKLGTFSGGTIDLGAGDYQVWLRATDDASGTRPVRILPETLTIS